MDNNNRYDPSWRNLSEKDLEDIANRVKKKNEKDEKRPPKPVNPHSLKSPVGIAINEIAHTLLGEIPFFKQGLAQKPLFPSKPKKKQEDDEESVHGEHEGHGSVKKRLKGTNPEIKKKVYNKSFGEKLGGMLGFYKPEPLQQRIEPPLVPPPRQLTKEEKIIAYQKVQSDKLDVALKELKAIGVDIQVLKAARIKRSKAAVRGAKNKGVEKKTPAVRTTKNMKDATVGLKHLGFQEQEILEMLKGVDSKASVEDIIKQAMSAQKEGNKTERIPVPEVKEATKKARSKKVKAVPENQMKLDLAAPVPIVDKDVSDSAQKDTAASKTTADAKAAEQKREEEIMLIDKRLDDIDKKVGHRGVDGMIASLLGGLGMKILGMITSLLKKGATLLVRTVVNAFKSMAPRVAKFLGLDGLEGIGAALEGATGVAEVGVMAKGLYDTLSGTTYKEKKAATDDRLSKYGVKLISGGQDGSTRGYEIDGKQYTYDQLPKEYKNVIDAYGNPDQRAATAQKALAEIKANPTPYQQMQKNQAGTMLPEVTVSAKSPSVAREAADDSSSAPTIYNDNRTMAAPSKDKGSDQTVVIQTRNPEGSAGSYIGSIFDHPVVYPMP